MPTHNSINYQVQTVHVGPSPATGGHFKGVGTTTVAYDAGSGNAVNQLHRIQSCNYGWSVNRTPVSQFGEFAPIDYVQMDSPTVSLSLNYLLANFWNESGLGFVVDGRFNCLSGILNKTADDKNYFVKVVGEGQDAVGNTTYGVGTYVIGIGNGYITSYASQGAINSFPTVDLNVEALNMTFDTGSSGWIPAVFPANGLRMTASQYTIPTSVSSPAAGDLDISVLRPGDITLTFRERTAQDEGFVSNATAAYNTAGVQVSEAHIQSYNVSFDLSREAIQSLGTRYAHTREITPPIDCSLTVEALVRNLTTGNLADAVNCDKSYDVEVNIKKPVCPGEAQPVICRYILKNAKMNSQSYSSDIGSKKSATLEFVSQIGGPSQMTKGLFMSGVC